MKVLRQVIGCLLVHCIIEQIFSFMFFSLVCYDARKQRTAIELAP